MAAIRTAFAAHADAARAPAMQAYMKSALPFFGIGTPLRRQLVARAVAGHPAPDASALAATMRALHDEASHREEWYAAIEVARIGPQHRAWFGPSLLPVYERLITGTAWWDCCDSISGDPLPALLLSDPQAIKPALRRWAAGDDLWLRRAAILVQRRLPPAAFDRELFDTAVLPTLQDARFNGEFFIRKAIGWALRERSYAAPGEVQAFCQRHAASLSPLTVREALKAVRRGRALTSPIAPANQTLCQPRSRGRSST